MQWQKKMNVTAWDTWILACNECVTLDRLDDFQIQPY